MDYDIELTEPRNDQVSAIREMKNVKYAGLSVKCAVLSKYEDKELDKKEYIADVHVMTYDEANRILNNKSIIDNNVAYWLGNANDYSTLYMIINGKINWSSIGYYGIRLVVNFNEGVYIASGDGTEANPYVLGKD